MVAGEGLRRARIGLFAALTGLAAPAPGATLSPTDMATLMQAMAVMGRLWNQVMGGTGSGFDWSAVLGGSTLPHGAWSNPPAWPGAAMQPWTGTGMPWSGTPGGAVSQAPRPGTRGAAGTPPPGTGSLDGLWMAPNGVVLWIQGERFILMRSGQALSLGTLRFQGGRLTLRDGRTGIARQYAATLDATGLTLRDALGRTVTYRRTQGPAR
jgi:hypothetical protein